MADVRDRLLDAAARIYAEHGFRGATTRRIAGEAGVNEVTLFRQFGSKESLLQQAVERAGLCLEPPALPAEPSNPAAELEEWAAALLTQLSAHRSLIRTAMGEIETHPEVGPSCGAAPALAADGLRRYLARLREAGWTTRPFDASAAAALLLGALFADAIARDVMPGMYRGRAGGAARQYVRLFLGALGVDG